MTRRARQLNLTFDHEIVSSVTDRFAALFAVPFECAKAHMTRQPRRSHDPAQQEPLTSALSRRPL